MALVFDEECQAAINLAKASVPEGQPVDVGRMMAALVHATRLKERFPRVAQVLPAPQPVGAAGAPTRPVAPELKPLLQKASDEGSPITAEALLRVLVLSQPGAQVLEQAKLPPAELEALRKSFVAAQPRPTWRGSAERQELIGKLSIVGRMLTDVNIPATPLFDRENVLNEISRSLVKMVRNDVILVGPAGVGKSTIVKEFVRRVAANDPSLPVSLRDRDVFELAADYLRSGANLGMEFMSSLRSLLELLAKYPQVLLFVDPCDALFPANEHFKQPYEAISENLLHTLTTGATSVIGCMDPQQYHRCIERKPAWANLFNIIRIPDPSPETTRQILGHFRTRAEAHYAPLKIGDELLPVVVETATRAYPNASDPLRAMRFLDEACAIRVTEAPNSTDLDRQSIATALSRCGRPGVTRATPLTEGEVYQHLSGRLMGQDDVLRAISTAFVSGLSGWAEASKPRGVFLFGGPTGVGKTETALLLAQLLGGDSASLIRIDCNTLQPSGHEKMAVLWPLLGVPAGFAGHGEPGLLSRVRERPECVVLFDEFEKADPAVGKLLLRILDTGQEEDNDGFLLDFRRSFIIFTSNLGCDYEARVKFGLRPREEEEEEAFESPRVSAEAIHDELVMMGYGREFLGRIGDTFLFQGLRKEARLKIVQKHLADLAREAGTHSLSLTWLPAVEALLLARCRPAFGARQVAELLRRVARVIAAAEGAGELDKVQRIELRPSPENEKAHAGNVRRVREGNVLVVYLS